MASVRHNLRLGELVKAATSTYMVAMRRTLTIKRSSAVDLISVAVMVLHPSQDLGGRIQADLDTGCDHTCIRRDVLAQMGIATTGGRAIPVHGVTGSGLGSVVRLDLGLQMDDGHKVTITNHEVVVLDAMSSDCLLGRDLLQHFGADLQTDGTVILSFDL